MDGNPPDAELLRIYASAKTIAVVGASTNPAKPAHTVPAFLQRQGYRIVPVSPAATEILGERAYPDLESVPDDIDVVDVFRPAAETPAIARQAVAAGAQVLWLQQGIVSEEAAQIAREGGLQVVMGICMGSTYNRLGLGGSGSQQGAPGAVSAPPRR